MKIRTLDQLTEKIDSELARRKKEISSIYLLSKKEQNINQNYITRIGLVFLYSHWEGFIKSTSENYFRFVKGQKIKFSELKINFLALKFKSIIAELKKSDSNNFYIEVATKLFTSIDSRVNFDENLIDTNSNLTSRELVGILNILGLENNKFELKHNLIDEQLVKFRNQIAHGELVDYDFETFDQLKESILEIMDEFKIMIMNLACLKLYLK